MIEIKNISYQINSKIILNHVSCNIEDNMLTAIIGPNGSGKSTLLKCIMQFLKYSGEILVDGTSSFKGFGLAKQVTYLAQTQNISFPHTVFDTVLMGRRPRAPYRYTKTDFDLTYKMLKQMNLYNFKERPIDCLSGGELQKTLFARCLVQDTKHILLDEPFNNLDPYYQIIILKKLIELKNKKSIAVVLHDISLLRFFDKILIVKDKKIIESDNYCTLLEHIYGVKFDKFKNKNEIVNLPIM